MNERKVVVINPTTLTSNENIVNSLNVKKRVCAYARVSTNQEDQLNSYNAQIKEYETRIKSNPDWEFVKLYADEGLSGTSTKFRKSFLEMISDAKEGKIDLILTKSLSRFSRNTVDSLTIIRELRELNVDIFFEKENLYSSDSKVDFMLTIFSSIAQEEARNISENVKWGIRKRFQEGKVKINTKRFLGYTKDEAGNLKIVEDEAHIIRKVFNLYIAGKSYKQICDILTQKEYVNATGNVSWVSSTIKSILENEKYTGDVILQKTVKLDYLSTKTVVNDNIVPKYHIMNNHPAIITKEMFRLVQLKKESKYKNRTSTFTYKYPLSGIVICVSCGRPKNRNYYNYKKPSQRIVLTCKNNYRDKAKCDIKPIDNQTLELTCAAALKELNLYDDGIVNRTLDIIKGNLDQNKLLNKVELLNDEIRMIEEEIVVLINNKIKDTDKTKDKYYNELYLEKKEIIEDKETEIKNIEKEIVESHQLNNKIKKLKEFLESDSNTVSTVIRAVIKKVIVVNSENVIILISKSNLNNISTQLLIEKSLAKEPLYKSKHIDHITGREIFYSVVEIEEEYHERSTDK